ncbi:MAG TPA: hypothetical protein VH877_17400 [Polyangia bacterium]|nr:hypothetical protein [Polyangia bacterium]
MGLVLGLVLGLGLAAAAFLPRGTTVEDLWARVRGLPVIPPEGEVTPQEPNALEPTAVVPKDAPAAPVPRAPSARRPQATGPDRSLERRTPCGVSSGEMNQMRDAHAAALLRCFQPELAKLPAAVGLTSNWEVAIDGHGRVRRVTPHLVTLDYKRSEEEQRKAPYNVPGKDAPAVRCATREITSWNFSPYIANPLHLDLLMDCNLTVTLQEPR